MIFLSFLFLRQSKNVLLVSIAKSNTIPIDLTCENLLHRYMREHLKLIEAKVDSNAMCHSDLCAHSKHSVFP